MNNEILNIYKDNTIKTLESIRCDLGKTIFNYIVNSSVDEVMRDLTQLRNSITLCLKVHKSDLDG